MRNLQTIIFAALWNYFSVGLIVFDDTLWGRVTGWLGVSATLTIVLIAAVHRAGSDRQ